MRDFCLGRGMRSAARLLAKNEKSREAPREQRGASLSKYFIVKQ